MHIKDWEKKAANGVIKQIEKSIKQKGELSGTWKSYLKNMNRHMLKVMKTLEHDFMDSIEIQMRNTDD